MAFGCVPSSVKKAAHGGTIGHAGASVLPTPRYPSGAEPRSQTIPPGLGAHEPMIHTCIIGFCIIGDGDAEPLQLRRVAMLVDGLQIEIVGLDGSPLRRLVLDPTKDYQPIP